ncbi:MAG: hypothetical protein FJ253_05865 [Phycisphaerae bacterium]|nr:hypothetical protein [Phycisphaerae bacterium]
MGIVTRGIPEQITIDLARLNRTSIFVETGTYKGDTTRWAAKHFEAVHTIERAANLYDLCSAELRAIKGVTPHLGDSRRVLPGIVRDLGDRTAVVWLDGHWSGAETAGAEDECPLLDELACLSNRANDIILIDDARMFLCAPPAPHNASQWPTLAEIVNALQDSGRRHLVQVVDDVIFIVPRTDALVKCLVDHAQRRATANSDALTKRRIGSRFLDRIRRRLR